MPKTRTWSRLATSVLSGDSEIVLEGNDYPNWQVGEEIVIAPSGWNPEESEIRTITSYDGSTRMHHSELLQAHTHTHTHKKTNTQMHTHIHTQHMHTLPHPLRYHHSGHSATV